mmetsp:Transcript_607/g.1466  ORF Transcript_607/g.1466 Transcript_607/m.1466 type:complete len:596 (-) Transcript_607:93-1880(-)
MKSTGASSSSANVAAARTRVAERHLAELQGELREVRGSVEEILGLLRREKASPAPSGEERGPQVPGPYRQQVVEAGGANPQDAERAGEGTMTVSRSSGSLAASLKECLITTGVCHGWEDPAEQKVTPPAVDKCEVLLRTALERNRDFKRFVNNPPLGVQELFQRLDKNHSGKVDKLGLQGLCKALDFEADQKTISALFSRYDVDRSGYLTVDELTRVLFKPDGDTEIKAKSAIARVREVLSLRAGGFGTLRAMGNQFRMIDRDKSGQLTTEDFSFPLDTLFSGYDMQLSTVERNALFQLFDFGKSGTVSYDEFVRGVRGDMNDFRVGLVKQAFAALDKDGSGVVVTQEMASTYDVSQNPAVKSGKVTPAEAIGTFMHYDATPDGRTTLAEFIENYQWVSSSIDGDDHFESMIRNAWHISGGQGWCDQVSEQWEVVWKSGVNVRAAKDTSAEALCTKSQGERVSGRKEGPWLALTSEPGFMLTSSGTHKLLGKVRGSGIDHFYIGSESEEEAEFTRPGYEQVLRESGWSGKEIRRVQQEAREEADQWEEYLCLKDEQYALEHERRYAEQLAKELATGSGETKKKKKRNRTKNKPGR